MRSPKLRRAPRGIFSVYIQYIRKKDLLFWSDQNIFSFNIFKDTFAYNRNKKIAKLILPSV